MIPLFRLGLGLFVGNPITGYIMVVKTMGRKTGKTRYAPVNYAIRGGKVYCMAGFGKDTHWYRNLQSQPNLELLMPSGPVAGAAEDITHSNEAVHIIRQLLKNSGLAGFLVGFNPYTISNDELRERMKDFPLVCIRPTGIGSGAADASGWLWILSFAVTALALWLVFR
jgi:deazaflavin-dependent oxidoreductase (nitroreductase family)